MSVELVHRDKQNRSIVTPFFSEVISWAMNMGLEVEMADRDVLFFNRNGNFAVMVGKSGVLAYHQEAHDILDEVTKIRKRIPAV